MSVNILHQFSHMRRGAEGMLSRYVRGEPVKPIGEGPEGQAGRATFIPTHHERNDEVEAPGRSGWVAKLAKLATHRSSRSCRSVTFAKIANYGGVGSALLLDSPGLAPTTTIHHRATWDRHQPAMIDQNLDQPFCVDSHSKTVGAVVADIGN